MAICCAAEEEVLSASEEEAIKQRERDKLARAGKVDWKKIAKGKKVELQKGHLAGNLYGDEKVSSARKDKVKLGWDSNYEEARRGYNANQAHAKAKGRPTLPPIGGGLSADHHSKGRPSPKAKASPTSKGGGKGKEDVTTVTEYGPLKKQGRWMVPAGPDPGTRSAAAKKGAGGRAGGGRAGGRASLADSLHRTRNSLARGIKKARGSIADSVRRARGSMRNHMFNARQSAQKKLVQSRQSIVQKMNRARQTLTGVINKGKEIQWSVFQSARTIRKSITKRMSGVKFAKEAMKKTFDRKFGKNKDQHLTNVMNSPSGP